MYILDSIHKQDLTVLKYDPDGTLLWTAYYDGGQNDIAVDVVVDASNNIYVTGAKAGSFLNLSDYVTLKITPAGLQSWATLYDFNGLIDVPIGIQYETSTQELIVSGTSASSINNYDFASVRYTANTGTQVFVNRQSSVQGAANQEVAMTIDALGNVYHTGKVWNGSNFDIHITKFNKFLVLQWSVTHPGYGYNDCGTDIKIDNAGNPIVTGYLNKALNGSRELIVLKLNAAGVILWQFKNQPVANASLAEGYGIKINANNAIYVGGNQTVNGNQNIFILKLDANGKGSFLISWGGTFSDHFFDLMLDRNTIFVTAQTETAPGVLNNVVLRYEERNIKPTFVHTGISHVANELIVSFNPNVLKMATINDKKFTFGKLSDFVADSICAKINSKLSSERNICRSANFEVRKVFYDMTAKDSLSTTRLGDVIKVPKFYGVLTLSIPSSLSYMTLAQIETALNTIKPSIFYAEKNYGARLASVPTSILPNDGNWGAQSSLHPTPAFPNAHINVDSCWATTSGEPYVRVGIFDSGIQTSHLEFDSLIYGGQDFTNLNWPNLGNDASNSGHGTKVTGIISGNRDNVFGIAGIAGRNDSVYSKGVTVYDCKVLTNDVTGYDSIAAYDRIAYGLHRAIRGDSSGFAVNIINHSMVLNTDSGFTYADTVFKNKLMQNELVFAARNGVAFVGAKNGLVTSFAMPGYPADWNPEIVTCVGGSGSDGEYGVAGLGNTFNNTGWGVFQDFLAPGSAQNVLTTDKGNNVGLASFGGASSAVPHVSGTYALLMSHFNHSTPNWDNLLHEDCENILKRTATDLAALQYSETPGYDSRSGWGRINAYKALKNINKNFYRFRHLTYNHCTSYTFSISSINTAVSIAWPAMNTLPAGTYSTDVYEITTTITYTLAPGETIIDKWPMYKECIGYNGNLAKIYTDRPYHAQIISVTNTQAVLKAYTYKILANNTFYPADPFQNGIKSGITLYTYDTGGTGVSIKNNQEVNKNFLLRPNPNTGEFAIFFGSEVDTKLTYKVFDMLGRTVKSGSYQSVFGPNNIYINMNDVSNGIYIVNVIDNTKVIYKQKVIKN
jgi:hypothetical protein